MHGCQVLQLLTCYQEAHSESCAQAALCPSFGKAARLGAGAEERHASSRCLPVTLPSYSIFQSHKNVLRRGNCSRDRGCRRRAAVSYSQGGRGWTKKEGKNWSQSLRRPPMPSFMVQVATPWGACLQRPAPRWSTLGGCQPALPLTVSVCSLVPMQDRIAFSGPGRGERTSSCRQLPSYICRFKTRQRRRFKPGRGAGFRNARIGVRWRGWLAGWLVGRGCQGSSHGRLLQIDEPHVDHGSHLQVGVLQQLLVIGLHPARPVAQGSNAIIGASPRGQSSGGAGSS